MKLFSFVWGTGRASWAVPWIFAWAVCLSGQNLSWEEYSYFSWEHSVCKSLCYTTSPWVLWCHFAVCFHSFVCSKVVFVFWGFFGGGHYSSPYPVVFFYSVTVIVLHFLRQWAIPLVGDNLCFFAVSYVYEKAEYVDWVLTFIAVGFHLFRLSFHTVFFNLVSSGFVLLPLFLLQDNWSLALSDVCMPVALIQVNSSLWIQNHLYSYCPCC